MTLPAFMTVRGDDVEIRVKAVPGAKRDAIAGALGDRLKVRVAQPPEGGKANEAIRELLAATTGLPLRAITLAHGESTPQKSLRIAGAATEATRIAQALS